MAKTMSQLNKTNKEQLIAEKNKLISITIQASNNKVKDKVKRVVQKEKNIEPIKQISKEKVVTKTNNNKVSKKASRKRIGVPRKEVMKKKKEM